MLEFLKTYVELQKTDAERAAIVGQINAYPAMLAALEARVAQARRAVEALKSEKKSGEIEEHRIEVDMRAIEDKNARYGAQEGQIVNEKQLGALEHELATARQQMSPLEDRALELMTRADELAEAIPKAEEALRRAEEEAVRERARIEEQIASKREMLALIERDRERLRALLDPVQLKDYDNLSERHPGKVVVEARGDACGGCHLPILPNLMVSLRKGTEPTRCSYCLRFLVTKES
jgi:predicted  nucleic acid-binding Zn-ribbon protein